MRRSGRQLCDFYLLEREMENFFTMLELLKEKRLRRGRVIIWRIFVRRYGEKHEITRMCLTHETHKVIWRNGPGVGHEATTI